jgi:hypothetical protein
VGNVRNNEQTLFEQKYVRTNIAECVTLETMISEPIFVGVNVGNTDE